MSATNEPASRPASAASTRRMAMGLLGAFILLLLAAAAVLWVKLGTAVFFEVVRAGIAYCF